MADGMGQPPMEGGEGQGEGPAAAAELFENVSQGLVMIAEIMPNEQAQGMVSQAIELLGQAMEVAQAGGAPEQSPQVQASPVGDGQRQPVGPAGVA